MTAPVFTNPMSAVEAMLRELVAAFKGITRARGYSCDMGEVFTEQPDEGKLTNFPSVALIRGRTEIENEDQSDQEWHKRIFFTALVFLRSEDPTWDRLRVQQDIEAMLGNNWMVNDRLGNPTARIVTLEGDRPFGMYMNRPQIGFALDFSVRLAQSISDPSVTT